MDKKWIVFAPSQSKVVIKHQGKYYFYKHKQVLDKEEPFFTQYARIFKPHDEAVEKPAPKPEPVLIPKVKEVEPETFIEMVEKAEEEIAAEAEVKASYESVEETIEKLDELELTEVSKGWYVVMQGETQVFPEEEGKKARKKKAEEYIKENS